MRSLPLAWVLVLLLLLGFASAGFTQVAHVDESLPRLDALFPARGPIPVIYAYGEPYERGVQIGTQLRTFDPAIVQKMADRRWDWVMTGIEHEISRSEMLELIPDYLKAIRETMGPEIVDEYMDEMRGVADGAHVSFDDLFIVNLGGHYRKYFIDERGHNLSYYDGADGCSSIAVWGKATTDGKMIVSHNCDWARDFPNNAHAAVVMYPAKGNPLIYAAPIGTWGSHHISSDRLFVAGLALGKPKAKPRYLMPGGPNGMLQRWIVQYAQSAEDALSMLESKGGVGDRGYASPSGNLVYVDENEAMYLQTAPDKIARIPNEDGYNLVTNHIVLDEMRPHFVARKPRAVGSGFVDPEAGSINRRQSEKYLIEKNYGKLDVKAVIDIMSSHYDISSGRDNIFADTACQHGEYKGRMSGTNLSTVVKLAERTVWIALGNPCVSPYTKITLGSREDVVRAADEAMRRSAASTTQQP
jgi:isopenicillin-N N-acyltransferase-like protein